MPQPSLLRTSVTIVAVAGLALTGCTPDEEVDGDDLGEPTAEDTGMLQDDDPLVDGSPTPTSSPETAGGEQPPVVPTVEVPGLDAQCFLEPDTPQVDRVTYAVPTSWQVEGSCEFLDPDLEDLPEEATEAEAAVIVSTTTAAYGDVMGEGPALEDVTTWLGARAGYQAARRTGVATGEALTPAGTPVLSWGFDLDVGTDEDGGVLTISSTSEDQQVQAVADAIANTVVIQPAAERQAENSAPESLAIVRTEGGGTPFSVTYDGDCFALRPDGAEDGRADQECGLDPTTGPIVARVLGEDVVVGYAPATSIAVQSADLAPPYGLTANIEGGSVFAFRVDELPEELTAIGPGGEELVTAPLP